jgi:hypothetical protein
MQKLVNLIENLFVKSFWAFGLALLIFATNLSLPSSSYASTPAKGGAKDVIQPFELTNPAATRSEAYDDVAKLNKNPKELIAAEAKEQKAEEKVYKEKEKAAKSVWNK